MKELLALLRRERPLIHCIANLVTAGDCANILLAAGASPIMAKEPAEMEEIVSACQALVLNTGTPDDHKFFACRLAGATANRLEKPVILDPVGVGASAYRQEQLSALLNDVHPNIIRANLNEVEALLSQDTKEHGVDCLVQKGLHDRLTSARALAVQLNCVVLLSGEPDLVTDGRRSAAVFGGSARMAGITGAGCMLSALLGAFAAVSPSLFDGALEASRFWKSCASYAQKEADKLGAGSFRIALFDGAQLLTEETEDTRTQFL